MNSSDDDAVIATETNLSESAPSPALERRPAPAPWAERSDVPAPVRRAGRWRSRSALMFGTVSCQMAIFGIQTLQAIAVARILGPEARGQYATVLFYPQTLLYAGLLGTLLSIARRAARNETAVDELRRAAWRTGWRIGWANLALVVVLSLAALPAEKQSLTLLCVAAGLILPVEHARLSLLAVDHGREAFHRYNAQRLWAALVYPLLVAVVWLAGWATLETVIAAAILAPLAGLAAMRIGVSESLLAGRSSPRPRDLMREGLPFGAAQVSAAVFERLDLVLVLWFTSFRQQGLYAAAAPAASLLLIAPHALALFAFNAGARHSGPTAAGKVATAFGKLALLQCATAAALALVLAPVMRLVFGREFSDSVPVALALLPAYALSGFTRSAEAYLQGRNRAARGVWSRVAGGLVMVVAAWLLLDRWQTIGVAIAASIGHAVAALGILTGLAAECRGHDRGSENEALAAGAEEPV